MKKMDVLAVAVAIVLIVVIVLSTEPQLGIARNQGLKWGAALQVSYPEYQIIHRGSADTDRDFFRAWTVVEVDTHENAATSAAVRQVHLISQNIFGSIDIPMLPRTSMTPFLKKFQEETSLASERKADAIERVKSMSVSQRAVVLVELVHPTREDSLPIKFENGQWKRFFLSGGHSKSGKPVYWWPGIGGCTSLALTAGDCGARSVIADYRQWVGHFTDGDTQNLSKLGLDLQDMRRAAKEGRVYGFIHATDGRADLLKLLRMPEIRAVHIVETVDP